MLSSVALIHMLHEMGLEPSPDATTHGDGAPGSKLLGAALCKVTWSWSTYTHGAPKVFFV